MTTPIVPSTAVSPFICKVLARVMNNKKKGAITLIRTIFTGTRMFTYENLTDQGRYDAHSLQGGKFIITSTVKDAVIEKVENDRVFVSTPIANMLCIPLSMIVDFSATNEANRDIVNGFVKGQLIGDYFRAATFNDDLDRCDYEFSSADYKHSSMNEVINFSKQVGNNALSVDYAAKTLCDLFEDYARRGDAIKSSVFKIAAAKSMTSIHAKVEILSNLEEKYAGQEIKCYHEDDPMVIKEYISMHVKDVELKYSHLEGTTIQGEKVRIPYCLIIGIDTTIAEALHRMGWRSPFETCNVFA